MQLLFCVVFALSCTMFELIIFEILDVLAKEYARLNYSNTSLTHSVVTHSTRYIVWRVSLSAMLGALILLLPLYTCYLAVQTFKVFRMFAFLCAFFPYLIAIRQSGGNKKLHVLLSLAMWGAFFAVFWKLGNPFPILSDQVGESRSLIATCVVCVILAGFQDGSRLSRALGALVSLVSPPWPCSQASVCWIAVTHSFLASIQPIAAGLRSRDHTV